MDGGAQLVVFALIGALVGFFCGMIPFRAANERGQSGLAIGAMITCVLMGLIGGCFLALPTAYVFKWISMSVGVVENNLPFSHSAPSGFSTDYRREQRYREREAPAQPYTILGTAVVCNNCGKACSKVDGKPPKECPNCDRRFSDGPKELPKVFPKAKRAPAEPIEDDLVPLERA